jgi:RNA polymerase sigma factor (sigma-70 family)
MTEDSVDGPCWIDAFPWIESASRTRPGELGGSPEPWWRQPIDASGTPVRADRLALLSDLALERLARWTIGQILPGLPSETVLSSLPLPARARNALGRFGFVIAADIQGQELADLLDWPQVGVGTVDTILQALADASTWSMEPVDAPAIGGEPDARTAFRRDRAEQAALEKSVGQDLRTIAAWHVAVGLPTSSLLGDSLPSGTPSEIVKARQRLTEVCAGDLLDEVSVGQDAAALLQQSITTLDERTQEVLVRRFFADHPATLDELGKSLGLTRERIRQIESKARARMTEALEANGPLELVAAAAREVIGTVLPLDDLLQLLPALARPVDAAAQPAWRVLDRLDDAYEIEDAWCVAPTMVGAQSATQARLQELVDQHGVLRLDEAGLLNEGQGEDRGRESLSDWLRYCGYVVQGDFVFTRTQSVGDRAASILSVEGSPLSSQEIVSRFEVERSVGSLKNAMSVDQRFERVDRDLWALTEWGLESYTGVRALVREEVARAGGTIRMDELIEHITGRYSVTSSSVMAYASAPPFEAREGVVRLAAAERDVRKTPERTRRLYRRESEWLYRAKITKDHLRGSGSVAPIALAGILNLQFGQSHPLATPTGPFSVSWTGNQPSFGSIRRFLIADDISIDTEVFLVVDDDGTFRIEVVPDRSGDDLADALSLVGGPPAMTDPLVALARAIGLPDDSPAASVIGGYRERGDTDIADLLLAVKARLEGQQTSRTVPSAEIDEIMDLL